MESSQMDTCEECCDSVNSPESKCNICGNHATNEEISLGGYSIHKCTQCGLSRLKPFPAPSSFNEIYDDSYYTVTPPVLPHNLTEKVRGLVLETFWAYPSQKSAWLRLVARLSLWPLRNKVIPVPFPKTAPLLDIGCGNGQRLAELSAYGNRDLFGVEPCQEAARHAATVQGATIHISSLEQAAFPDSYFELIIMNQVLEHVPKPLETLLEVRRILRPSGLLYLTVPNYGSIEAGLFGQYWGGLQVPAHLYHFSGKTLRQAIVSAGFTLKLCRTDTLPSVTANSLAQWAKVHQGWLGKLVRKMLPTWLLRVLVFPQDVAGKGNMLRVIATPKIM